jgi:myo-inositol 2-dehydrogenase/D-chiro-inositol 1-dehydrogenase
MNVLIVGDGPEETAWGYWFLAHPEYRLATLYPGLHGDDFGGIPLARDLDEGLASPGLNLVLVGGPLDLRGEALRRAAAEGLAIICLHPPGEDSEAYYQVALSKSETGAVVVPDLPLRLHPGVSALVRAMTSGDLGTFRGIRHECSVGSSGTDLVRHAFARAVDVVRSLVGEIEALTASGNPAGDHPDIELVVQLRAAQGRQAEVRVWSGPLEPSRLTVSGSSGSLTLEYDPLFHDPARLVRRAGESTNEPIGGLEPWDPLAAIVQTLRNSWERRSTPAQADPSPSLADGTRAMELSEAAARSLRRGRTIDLHYEAISEESSFKSIMTSTGCVILLSVLAILPLALAGPALGFNWTIYIAYIIPPVLVIFAVMQILRFGIRSEDSGRKTQGHSDQG